jgi:hypothetical protein
MRGLCRRAQLWAVPLMRRSPFFPDSCRPTRLLQRRPRRAPVEPRSRQRDQPAPSAAPPFRQAGSAPWSQLLACQSPDEPACRQQEVHPFQPSAGAGARPPLSCGLQSTAPRSARQGWKALRAWRRWWPTRAAPWQAAAPQPGRERPQVRREILLGHLPYCRAPRRKLLVLARRRRADRPSLQWLWRSRIRH